MGARARDANSCRVTCVCARMTCAQMPRADAGNGAMCGHIIQTTRCKSLGILQTYNRSIVIGRGAVGSRVRSRNRVCKTGPATGGGGCPRARAGEFGQNDRTSPRGLRDRFYGSWGPGNSALTRLERSHATWRRTKNTHTRRGTGPRAADSRGRRIGPKDASLMARGRGVGGHRARGREGSGCQLGQCANHASKGRYGYVPLIVRKSPKIVRFSASQGLRK